MALVQLEWQALGAVGLDKYHVCKKPQLVDGDGGGPKLARGTHAPGCRGGCADDAVAFKYGLYLGFIARAYGLDAFEGA